MSVRCVAAVAIAAVFPLLGGDEQPHAREFVELVRSHGYVEAFSDDQAVALFHRICTLHNRGDDPLSGVPDYPSTVPGEATAVVVLAVPMCVPQR